MWFLEPAGPSEQSNAIYYLIAACSYVGRPPKTAGVPGADVLVSGDSSVSKHHAKLLLNENSGDSAGEKRPSLAVKDTSKFGTYVNETKVGDAPVELAEGDTIRFGTKSIFRIRWFSIVCCYGLDIDLNDQQHKQCNAAGIVLLERWSSKCTHVLVSPSTPLGAIHACGSFSRKCVVAFQWILAVLRQHVCKNNLPIVSDFQKDLPALSPNVQPCWDLLQGMRLFWATRSEDPYSETLAQLFGATIVDQTTTPANQRDGRIAVFGGSRTLEIGYVPPSAVGHSWTNEKMLLDSVWSADKTTMIQSPVQIPAIEQESVSVLSSGDEQDQDTVVLEESLKSPASSVKLKRSVDDGLLQSFAKRQRPIPVQQFTEPVTSSPSRAAEEKASDPGGVIQQPKLNEEHIKPHNKRAAMGCGLASIFAAVLDSDEEPDISGLVSTEKPNSMQVGVDENDPTKCEAVTNGPLNTFSKGLEAIPKVTGTNMSVAQNQPSGRQPDQKKENQCVRETEIQKHVIQGICVKKDEEDFKAVKCKSEKGIVEGMELSTEHKQDPKRVEFQPWRTISTKGDEKQMGINHKITIGGVNADEQFDEPQSTLLVEPLLVSPKLVDGGAAKSKTMGRTNYKKFQKVWRTNSSSGGSLRLVAGDALYRETSFSSTDFIRVQEELQKSKMEADALFKAEVPRRVGLTGRARVVKGKKTR